MNTDRREAGASSAGSQPSLFTDDCLYYFTDLAPNSVMNRRVLVMYERLATQPRSKVQ